MQMIFFLQNIHFLNHGFVNDCHFIQENRETY